MPTYFGPTNIPPYEAFKLGTPVIYPNLEGLKDQIYEEGLIDLNNPDSLALKIKKLSTDKNFRTKMINNGYKLSKKMSSYKRLSKLNSILNQFKYKYSNFR